MRLIDADALLRHSVEADRMGAMLVVGIGHIFSAPAVSPWVKTSDRLPEPWVTVLLWDGGEMVSGYADDAGVLIEHRLGQVFRATHWMLPEPPGEEVEG